MGISATFSKLFPPRESAESELERQVRMLKVENAKCQRQISVRSDMVKSLQAKVAWEKGRAAKFETERDDLQVELDCIKGRDASDIY